MANNTVTPLSPTGEMPVDFYSWGDQTTTGLISKRHQMHEQLEEAFDSIEIEEDSETPELDYVLKVMGKDAGRIVIPSENIIKDAYYDSETKELVLVLTTSEGDKEVRIDVSNLIDTYTGDGTTIQIENNVISITDDVMSKFDTLQDNIDSEASAREAAINDAIDGLANEVYVDIAVSVEQNRAELVEKELSDKIDKIELKKETDLLYALYVNNVKHGEINIPKDQFLKDITYNSETKELIFTFETSESEKVIKVGIGDLIDTYTAGDGLTLDNNAFSVDFDKVASVEYVDTKTKNMVEWEYSTADRKHIVLDNHSNILGKSTEGGTYNLAMVSKWDVADFGSNQLHANLNSKDGQVTINDDKVIATTDDVTSSVNIEKERAEAAESQLDLNKADKEHTHEISEVNNLQVVLDTKLNVDDVQSIFKEQIYKLFNIDLVNPEDFNSTDMNNPSEKYAIIGDGETITLTSPKSIIAKELKLANVELSSESENKAALNVNASTIELENVILSGSWNKSVGGNTMISLNNTKDVNISDVIVDRTGGYNAVEIGLDAKGTANNIVIDGLKVNEALSNNSINIFSFTDNANITIQNCHFTEVSNPIRISNANYAKNVTITIKDCAFDKWESSSPSYAGLVLLQDYTSRSHGQIEERKPFSTFTIIIDNVTGPYGKIDNTLSMEEICGSDIVDKQLVYMYGDYYKTENIGEAKKPGLIPYSSEMFPNIIIK